MATLLSATFESTHPCTSFERSVTLLTRISAQQYVALKYGPCHACRVKARIASPITFHTVYVDRGHMCSWKFCKNTKAMLCNHEATIFANDPSVHFFRFAPACRAPPCSLDEILRYLWLLVSKLVALFTMQKPCQVNKFRVLPSFSWSYDFWPNIMFNNLNLFNLGKNKVTNEERLAR